MSRSSAVRASLHNDQKVTIDYIEACGDCFYIAIASALEDARKQRARDNQLNHAHDDDPNHTNVAQLRNLVAASMTEETFQFYSLLYMQQAQGFQFMDGIHSLDALRHRVQLRGQKVGAHRCIWADGFAMETIANYYRILLLIIDERFDDSQKFTRIVPASGSNNASAQPLCHETMTVMLHASRREHMNLIIYDGKKVPRLGDLPKKVRELWGIHELVSHSSQREDVAKFLSEASNSNQRGTSTCTSPESSTPARSLRASRKRSPVESVEASHLRKCKGVSPMKEKAGPGVSHSVLLKASPQCPKNANCVRRASHPGLCRILVDGKKVHKSVEHSKV